MVKYIFVSILLLAIMFVLSFYYDKSTSTRNSIAIESSCGVAYKTSDLYFKDAEILNFNIRFVYIADSINELQPNYDSILHNLNDFYKRADIQFTKYKNGSQLLVVNREMKRDMPSFVKYHLNYFKDDSTLTMYIYGDEQPNYIEDSKNVTGSAGGIGSNFFAVRRAYVYESTVLHEIGHCFFLMHTSEPDPTEKGLDLMYGDRICDIIKADPLSIQMSDSCTYKDGIGIYTKEELNQVMCNIMSYSYLNCRKCLSQVQRARMRFYIHESPVMKMSLIKLND